MEKRNVDPFPSTDSTQMRAAVLLDDVARDREAEAGPAVATADAGTIDLVEPFEDPLLGAARDADPVIGHGVDYLVVLDADRDLTSPPSG